MSTLFFNDKKNQLKFINSVVGIHDFTCNCNNPGFHCLKILAQQIGPELNTTDKDTIKKCLGDHSTADAVEDTGIDPGDLEKLFGDQEEDADDDNR